VISHNTRDLAIFLLDLPKSLDTVGRIGTIPHKVPAAQKAVESLDLHVGQHGIEGFLIAMDIRYDRISGHIVLQTHRRYSPLDIGKAIIGNPVVFSKKFSLFQRSKTTFVSEFTPKLAGE